MKRRIRKSQPRALQRVQPARQPVGTLATRDLFPHIEGPIVDLDAALEKAGLGVRSLRREDFAQIEPGDLATWWAALSLFAKIIVGTIAVAGLSYLSHLFRKPVPDERESSTYGWEAQRNTVGIGAAIPVIYGRHKTWPSIVQAFIETVNDDQFLYALCLVGQGEIQSINTADIKLNDQPQANFSDLQIETRLGTAGQSKIPWFDDVRITRSHGVALNNDPSNSTFTTIATNITAFVVALKFPNGLATLDGNGNLKSNVVNVTIEYRTPPGSGAWTLLITTDIREAKRNQFTRVFRIDNLGAGQYDIRVTRNSTGDRTAQSVYDMTYDTVDEITYGNTNFPNRALIGIRVRASDQLSGTFPRISCIAEGRRVRTRSGGAWTAEVYNRNPVWCVVDALTHTRYGGGMGDDITDADLDIASFEAGATYCDGLVDDLASGTHVRFRMDFVADVQRDFWDVVNEEMGPTFRAKVIRVDGKYRLIIDRPGTVAQAFGDVNMIEGSFETGWVSKSREEFDQVEVGFLDEANDFTQETVRFPTAPTNPKVKRIQLKCTRRAQAIREAKYHMNVVSALSRYVRFQAFLEALASEIGDIIEVSHDLPQWGYNGRVIAAALNGADHDITVDRDDLPTPTAHSMLIRHDDTNVPEIRSVISKTGRVVKCAAFSKVPVIRNSIFMYGPTNATSKKWRITNIALTKDLHSEITAVEYDEAIYDATGLVLPARSPSDLANYLAPPGSVTNLTLVTQLVRNNQGMDVYRLQIHWNNPATALGKGQYQYAQIWLSTDGGSHYLMIGDRQIDAPFPTVVIPLATYFVKVVTVATTGVAQKLSDAATASIVVTGDTTGPTGTPTLTMSNAIQAVVMSASGGDTDADFAGYEFHLSQTSGFTPDTTTLKASTPRWKGFVVVRVDAGTWYGKVRAVDYAGNGGNYSAQASAVSRDVQTGDVFPNAITTAKIAISAVTPIRVNPWYSLSVNDHFAYDRATGDDLDVEIWAVTKTGSPPTIAYQSGHKVKSSASSTTALQTITGKSNLQLRPDTSEFTNGIVCLWKVDFDYNASMPAADLFDNLWSVGAAGSSQYAWVKPVTGQLAQIKFDTGGPTTTQQTTITDVDPRSEHEYKIEMTTASSKLYVDGVLKATHSNSGAFPTSQDLKAQWFMQNAFDGAGPNYWAVDMVKNLAQFYPDF